LGCRLAKGRWGGGVKNSPTLNRSSLVFLAYAPSSVLGPCALALTTWRCRLEAESRGRPLDPICVAGVRWSGSFHSRRILAATRTGARSRIGGVSGRHGPGLASRRLSNSEVFRRWTAAGFDPRDGATWRMVFHCCSPFPRVGATYGRPSVIHGPVGYSSHRDGTPAKDLSAAARKWPWTVLQST